MKFSLEKSWGSESVGYRHHIRRAIHQQYGSIAKTDLFDLEIRPQLLKGYISISHTKGLGGFVFSDYPIGFDIELESRVTEPVVLRVSTQQEFLDAPSAAALWCAKEAAFKAMAETHQPKTITEFEISWSNSSSEEKLFFTVKETPAILTENGRGEITWHENFILATFEYRQ